MSDDLVRPSGSGLPANATGWCRTMRPPKQRPALEQNSLYPLVLVLVEEYRNVI